MVEDSTRRHEEEEILALGPEPEDDVARDRRVEGEAAVDERRGQEGHFSFARVSGPAPDADETGHSGQESREAREPGRDQEGRAREKSGAEADQSEGGEQERTPGGDGRLVVERRLFHGSPSRMASP